MQDIIKRRNIETRKSRTKKRKIRTSIIVIACIIFVVTCIRIVDKIKSSTNIKNNGVAAISVSKTKESEVNVGSNKNEGEPVKSEPNSVNGATNTPNETTNTNNAQVEAKPQENSESNSQAVNVEQALVQDGKKTAYLTFDDGPSVSVTPKILDALKKYKVNATFFVLGLNLEQEEGSKDILKRTFEDGNAIGNHSYTHNLSKLYPHNKVNVDYFMEEVDKTNNVLKSVLGQDFNTRIIRMPGGYMSRQYYNDPNLPAFDAKLKEKNMCNIDWNAYDFDSEGKWKNSEQLLNEVKSSVGNKEKVVVLMHDTYGKEETAKALPKIIEYLKGEGYEFKTLK